MGMALLFITHDLNLVRRFTHRVGVMERGRLVESGACGRGFRASRSIAYTQQLLASRPQRVVRAGGATTRRCCCAPKRCRCASRSPRAGSASDHFVAVRQATLQLKRGETLGIVGESGSGKTTLGMALLALQPIAGGRGVPGRRSASTMLTAPRCAPCAGACRWCSRIRSPRCRRGMTVGQIVGEGLALHRPELSAAERERAGARRCSTRSA